MTNPKKTAGGTNDCLANTSFNLTSSSCCCKPRCQAMHPRVIRWELKSGAELATRFHTFVLDQDLGKNIQAGAEPSDMESGLGKNAAEALVGERQSGSLDKKVSVGDLIGKYNEPEGGVVPKTADDAVAAARAAQAGDESKKPRILHKENPEFNDDWGVESGGDPSYGGRSSNATESPGNRMRDIEETENHKRAEGKGPAKAMEQASKQSLEGDKTKKEWGKL
ncbi:hypothetical protein M427DRAFT_219370 [Gonapodya prolifera JEL478]|uniref:Uncharacterized protein n=1 Tax=Gonapodya prolifera (strain JEL478) TaxID=1344416 RepID=A0A138ZYQ3_GONPJ|nr:hypothetical protein M427DRAFT_219370 [Gonapodya prolifera JEL478]|eukprot:KXS09637.1 hypothetical protein M427DRAFT_219370 [Gonapodya prolifera JEL478]